MLKSVIGLNKCIVKIHLTYCFLWCGYHKILNYMHGSYCISTAQNHQGCPTHSPWATCSPGRLWMWPNTKSEIHLKHYEIFFVIMCYNVFNVRPKTTPLLPVWPRDATRLDTPVRKLCHTKRYLCVILSFIRNIYLVILMTKILFLIYMWFLSTVLGSQLQKLLQFLSDEKDTGCLLLCEWGDFLESTWGWGLVARSTSYVTTGLELSVSPPVLEVGCGELPGWWSHGDVGRVGYL